MKNFRLISFLIIIATSLLFVQCTTDPIPGPAGEDGINGMNGTNGINGTTECAQCHNVSTSEAVHASYLFSGHAAGAAAGYAGGRDGCAQCHSNEGFIDYIEYGAATSYENPTPISCTTCHDMHTTFDFEGDGYDFALRTLAPVTLIVDAGVTIDYDGTSNACASCHQPRTATPTDNGMGLFQVTSTHWGPHHGPQVTMLEGIQGAEFMGSTDYPAPGTATHRTGASCTACHMGETSGEIDGNHTWIPTPTTCTQCHTNGAPDSVAGLEDDMHALLMLLEEVGILHEEDGAVHPVAGTYSIDDAQAAWNYLFVLEDASNGTHNPGYAKALIKNSIEALTAN